MRKAIIALAAAAALGLASVAAPAPAQAQSTRDILRGLAIGGAIVGGALLFGAAARAHLDPRWHPWAPVEGYYYVQGPVYAVAPPAPCPNGFWAYRINSRGQPYGNPRWVCPPQGYYSTHYIYR
jgi:hypothetical protein